jgi:hypothetical protein
MQEVASHAHSVELFAPAPERTRTHLDRLSTDAPVDIQAPTLTAALVLWRQSLHIMSVQFGPILAYSFFGLVGANIAGAIIATIVLTNAYIIIGGYTSYTNILYPQLIAQALAGVFTYTFARGAITWLALQSTSSPDAARSGWRAAFRATLSRWPSLIVSALVYGISITLCTAGLTLLLRDLRIDVTNIGRVNRDVDDITRAVFIRALGGIAPDPGAPFTELYAYVRYTLSRSAYYAWYLYRYTTGTAPLLMWLLGLSSLAAMIVVETLLRLRTVMVMRAEGPGPFAGLADCVRTGWRRFWFIAAQVWLLRLLMLAVGVLFIILPMTFVQSVFVPMFAQGIGSFWPYPGSNIALGLGSGLVGMLLIAFSIVFDTRLYVALQHASAQEGDLVWKQGAAR